MVEMLDPYIQENLAFFYSDPDQVYLFDGGQVKERIRFSFQDISTVFCEGRDEIEKLLNNCNELIDLYQECLGKVKSDQLAQKSFAEVMGLIIKKIRDHQQAKSHPPMQEEINVFSKRRVKQVHNNPIDNEARHSLILKQATGRHQTEEETEETYFYKDIVLNITKALQDMHDRHMKKTLDKLSKDFPDCVLNQHSKFETILNPDPMQSYIDHLGKLWIPKQVRKPQGSSSSGPDMRPNLAELATKVVFELFAQGAISTLVEELLSPFAFRMQDQMGKFGLKWYEVQDTSLLAQQAHSGGGNSKETNIHLGAKYLFYYAVNVLKRAGLVQENSRSKRQMQKLFFAVADHGNRS